MRASLITPDRFTADKVTVRAELERRARARQTITYGEAAALVGRAARGLGMTLDVIKAEKARRGRPGLSVLVIAMSTGLPSGVGSEPAARAKAIALQEAVFAAWSASVG